MLARAPLFLAVNAKMPAGTLGEFIAYAKSHPGELNYGSSGVGVHHLTMEAINRTLHLSMTHVPFKGVGESVPALIGGHIDVSLAAYAALSGAAKDHQIKLLATNGAQRSVLAPDLPSVAEFIPGFDLAPRIAIFARADTRPSFVRRIAMEATAAITRQDTAGQLKEIGIEPADDEAEDVAQVIRREMAHVTMAVQVAGLKPQ